MDAFLTYIEQHWVVLTTAVTAVVALYRKISKLERASKRHDVYDQAFEDLNSGMFAVLDGLHQLGCNGEVTKAREKFLESRAKV